MRKTFLAAALICSCLSATSFAGDDELFSDIPLDSTSSAPKKAAAAPRPQRRADSGSASLQTALLAAGYNARIDQNGNLSVNVTRTDWNASISMTTTENGRQMRLVMPLTTLSANTTVPAKTLQALLEANGTNEAAYFALKGTPQRIELITLMATDNIDSSNLRETFEAMADLAVKTKDVWNVAGSTTVAAATPVAPAPATPPVTSKPAAPTTPPATTPSTTTSLEGKYVAAPSKSEAFALQLKNDGTFLLVHVKNKDNTQSKGNFTLNGNALTLKGNDGKTISGTVSRTAEGFNFILGTGSKSVTLTFKKS